VTRPELPDVPLTSGFLENILKFINEACKMIDKYDEEKQEIYR